MANPTYEFRPSALLATWGSQRHASGNSPWKLATLSTCAVWYKAQSEIGGVSLVSYHCNFGGKEHKEFRLETLSIFFRSYSSKAHVDSDLAAWQLQAVATFFPLAAGPLAKWLDLRWDESSPSTGAPNAKNVRTSWRHGSTNGSQNNLQPTPLLQDNYFDPAWPPSSNYQVTKVREPLTIHHSSFRVSDGKCRGYPRAGHGKHHHPGLDVHMTPGAHESGACDPQGMREKIRDRMIGFQRFLRGTYIISSKFIPFVKPT